MVDVDTALLIAHQKSIDSGTLLGNGKAIAKEKAELKKEERIIEKKIAEDEEALAEVEREEAEIADEEAIAALATELGFPTDIDIGNNDNSAPNMGEHEMLNLLSLHFALQVKGSPAFSSLFKDWFGARLNCHARKNKSSSPTYDGSGRDDNGNGSGRFSRPFGSTTYGTMSTEIGMARLTDDHFEMDDATALSLAKTLNVEGQSLDGLVSWVKKKWNKFRGKKSKKDMEESTKSMLDEPYLGDRQFTAAEEEEYGRLMKMADDSVMDNPMFGVMLGHHHHVDDWTEEEDEHYEQLKQFAQQSVATDHSEERAKWFENRAALAADTKPTDGIISTIKNAFNRIKSHLLVPVYASDANVPDVLRASGDISGSLENTSETDEIHLHVKNSVERRFGVNLQKLSGVDNAVVYDVSSAGIYRSTLFKNKNYREEPVVLSIVFSNPLTHKKTSTDVMAKESETRVLKKSQLWITKTKVGGVHILLRFESANGNPVLSQVIFLAKTSLAFLGSNIGPLSAPEEELSKFILAGKAINIEAFTDTHTIQAAENARIAMSVAASHLRFAFPTVSELTTGKPQYVASDAALTNILRNYSNHLNRFGEKTLGDTRAASAQKRGVALANHIQQHLEGATDDKIRAVLQSITSAMGVFLMRDLNSPANAVLHRTGKFMATNVGLYESANALNSAFF
jgi:hypothetical protein